MSHKKRKRITLVSRRIGIQPLFYLVAFASVAGAQQVIVQPPQYSVPPPALQQVQNNNEMQVFNPEAEFLNKLQEFNPFQWGPVSFHPSLNYQFLYGTGIQSSPGNNAASIVQTVSPGFLFVIGRHWTLDYTPSWTFYSSSQFKNTLNHAANLSWGTTYEDWVLGVSQGYNRSDSSLVETGGQTDQETYSTAVNASYQFNNNMSVNLGLSQSINNIGNGGNSTNALGNLANSRSWSTLDWLNYQFWPRLNAGIGAGFGYTIQSGSPDSINEQYQARINWRATDKISFQLSGGVEDQQYLSGGAGDLITPIFGATIQYQPFEQTQLSLNASRSVSPSYFQSQNTETTSVSAGLSQRLLRQFNLGLSGGYSTTDYTATSSSVSGGRTDDTYSFSASLSHSLFKNGTVSLSYSYSDNSSNVPGFTYTSNQVGFQIGYQF